LGNHIASNAFVDSESQPLDIVYGLSTGLGVGTRVGFEVGDDVGSNVGFEMALE
jgi:hypothetical protein